MYMPRGFTLIELLMVISIISILSAVVLANLTSSRNRARNVAVTQEFSQIRRQIEANAGDPAVFYSGAIDGQEIKNVIIRLLELSSTSSNLINTCYSNSGDPTHLTSSAACGFSGDNEWVFWINLGTYDDSGGQDYFTCIGSLSSGVLEKLASGGNLPSGGSCS